MHQRVAGLLILLLITLTACSDSTHDPVSVLPSLSEQIDAGAIPPRDEDLAGYWERMSDSVLWNHLQRQGGYAVLGVKNPGEARGIWRATVLTQPATITGARNVARALRGITVIPAEDVLPTLRLKVESLEALASIRSKPFVDYLQPMYMEPGSENGSSMMSKLFCGWGDQIHSAVYQTPMGDFVSWGLAQMGIQDAWRRNAGELAVIGFTDTGVSLNQANLRANYATGLSSGIPQRWHRIVSVIPGGTDDQCGHGTRVAGSAVAPHNGVSMVGVAWRANAVSVRQGDGVSTSVGINSADAALAVEWAVRERFYPEDGGYDRRRIVSMAWGARSSHSNVEDAVRYNTYGRGALFLGASGSFAGLLTGAVFPSTMIEVISVSLVTANHNPISGIGYGDAVELAAIEGHFGTGPSTLQTVTLGGSSSAVTAVAGIAALVWTQYPDEPNHQIRHRLQMAGHNYPNRNTTYGYGVVNAYRAVGGFTSLLLSCPEWVQPHSTFTCTASARGAGPFTYVWENHPSQTGATATFQAGADGGSTLIRVHVTDTVENRTRSSHRIVQYGDQSGGWEYVPGPDGSLICPESHPGDLEPVLPG